MINNKKSILHIISSLANEGPVQELYEIISYIDFNKYDIHIITLRKEKENSLKNKFANLPIKIKFIDDLKKYDYLQYYKIVKEYIISNNIDIIHSHCPRSIILASFFKKQVIWVHSIYIYPGLQAKSLYGNSIGVIVNTITKHLIKKAHYPVACAKCVSDELLEKDNLNIEYIRNGVTVLEKSIDPKNNIKIKLNLDEDIRYFLSIGRLSPEKNFQPLIEAFIKADLKDFKLIIIGDGILMEPLKQITNENIILTGFKSNINDYLAASDFYITMSLTEGMALSTIFAMSSGLPLILSDIPPHKEIFELASENNVGIICNANNQDVIIDAILKMSKNETYNTLSSNIKDVFTANFTGEMMSNSYQKIYDRSI